MPVKHRKQQLSWAAGKLQQSRVWPISSSSLLLEMRWSSSTLGTGGNLDASSSFRSRKHVTSGAVSAASSSSDRPCRAVAGLVCRWSASSDRRKHGTFTHNLLISGPRTEAIMAKTYLTFKRLFRDIKPNSKVKMLTLMWLSKKAEFFNFIHWV